MYETRTVKKPDAPITEKQKKFLKALITKKYSNEIYIQQTLLDKLERMRVGEASDAIKKLLGLKSQ